MRTLMVAGLLLLGACGDDSPDSGPDEVEFMEQWSDVPDGPDYDGQPTKIDEENETIYIEDCDAARASTADGEPYDGWAYICA